MKQLRRRDFLKIFEQPQFVVAPMVDQSDAPYRVLCKLHGATLTYTQMINVRQFTRSRKTRASLIDWVDYPDGFHDYSSLDRPLIAQLAGSDVDTLIEAGKMLQDHVTAIDLNLGCPQAIAKRGGYGAYLLPQREKVCEIVDSLVQHLECPITVKIRKLNSEEETLSLCRDLEAVGASMITVHGRTREQNKQFATAADWNIIKDVRGAVRIPIIANGGIETPGDVERCIAETGAHGVMSSEAILENPGIFSGARGNSLSDDNYVERQLSFTAEYLNLVSIFASRVGVDPLYIYKLVSSVKGHLFRLLFRMFSAPIFTDLRKDLGATSHLTEVLAVFREMQSRVQAHSGDGSAELFGATTWYRRHPRAD